MIYTRGGDGGETSLSGGVRVPKDSIRIECMGEMDETNSQIGFLRSRLPLDHGWQKDLQLIQRDFMKLMGFIARPQWGAGEMGKNPLQKSPGDFEVWMDQMEKEMGESKHFLLPGGTDISALCHLLRTKTRTAERRLVTLQREAPVYESALAYLNRLSDLFFVMARYDMFLNRADEERWKLFRSKES